MSNGETDPNNKMRDHQQTMDAESETEREEREDRESIASDESDEMIEFDETEFDQRRSLLLVDMKQLESQFLQLKEELINEKQQLVNNKLKEIEDETAEEFTIPLKKLEQNMDIKIKLATLMRDYRLQNLEHIYNYEELSYKKSLEVIIIHF
jgi:breast cancer metastasis-suppressor 1 and related proteins